MYLYRTPFQAECSDTDFETSRSAAKLQKQKDQYGGSNGHTFTGQNGNAHHSYGHNYINAPFVERGRGS